MRPVFLRSEPDLTHWGEILDTFEDRTIFQTPAWLTFVAKTQHAEPVLAALGDDRRTFGYFTGVIINKFGFKILGSPFPGWTTAYMGLNLLPGFARRNAVQALADFAFSRLGCVHLEFMDRYLGLEELNGLGFQCRLYRGFEIDLTQREEDLFAHMSSACRRCIRKAQKNGVFVEEAQDLAFADDYYAQLKDVFAKRSLVPTYGVERVRELIKNLLPTGMLLLLRARDQEGNCIATGIFPAMNKTMYFWGGASWRHYQFLRPNEAIQWYAMNYWKHRGMQRYDMGGGGKYKRKFGGYPISVPWFSKSKYPWIDPMRNMAKHAYIFGQRWLGTMKHPSRLF